MQGAPAGGMFDLLPAGDSRRNEYGVRTVFHGGEKTAAANGYRNVVMFLLISEGSCHTAAAGIDFFDRIRERQRFFQIARANESLLMTMPVDESFRLLPLEFKLPSSRLFFLRDELF